MKMMTMQLGVFVLLALSLFIFMDREGVCASFSDEERDGIDFDTFSGSSVQRAASRHQTERGLVGTPTMAWDDALADEAQQWSDTLSPSEPSDPAQGLS